jgi:hypothetical protein
MPYKSDAQRRYFHAAEARGEISKETVSEFDQASKGKKLPEKVGIGHARKHQKRMEHAKKMWRGGSC